MFSVPAAGCITVCLNRYISDGIVSTIEIGISIRNLSRESSCKFMLHTTADTFILCVCLVMRKSLEGATWLQ